MGYGFESMENFFAHIDFEYVFLDLTKILSLDSIWSAPLRNYPLATAS